MEQADGVRKEVEWATDPDYILATVRESGFLTYWEHCRRSLTRTTTGLQYCINNQYFSALIEAVPCLDYTWACRMWIICRDISTLEDALLPLTVLQACDEPTVTATLLPRAAMEDDDISYDISLDDLPENIANVLSNMEREVNRYIATDRTRLICSLAKNLQFTHIDYTSEDGEPCEIYRGDWHESTVSFRISYDKAVLKRKEPGRFGRGWKETVYFYEDMFLLGRDKDKCFPIEALRTALQIPDGEPFFDWTRFLSSGEIPTLTPEELTTVFSLASYDYGFLTYDNVEDYRLAAPYRFPLNKKLGYPLYSGS